MRLYIKQRVFTFKDKYDIYDENQNPIYYVEGKMFSFFDQISLYNTHHQLEFFIKKKFSMFLSKYEIYKGSMIYAQVQQKFSFMKRRLDITSQIGNIQINGDFFSHNYTISLNDCILGSVRKKWLSWGDSYELDIPSSDYSSFFLCPCNYYR